MINRRIKAMLGVGAVALMSVTQAWGLEILATKTEAKLLVSDASPAGVHVEFESEMISDRIPEVVGTDVIVTWEIAGGVEPTPFRILIPAGCFVGDRSFFVDDFRACGVTATLHRGFGLETPLQLSEFEASLTPRRDGTHRLDVQAGGNPPDNNAPAILGTLGGGTVEITIGHAVKTVLLNVEAVSGAASDET